MGEKVCPICGLPLNEGERVIVCPSCKTPQHEECCEKNGGCGVVGCSRYAAPAKPISPACPVCGAALKEPDQRFCHSCGGMVGISPASSSRCSACGYEVPAGAVFCPGCGLRMNGGAVPDSVPEYPVAISGGIAVPAMTAIPVSSGVSVQAPTDSIAAATPKKKHRALIPVLCAAAAVILCTGAFAAYRIVRQNAIEKYLDKANDYASYLLDTSSDLEDIGNDIQNNWYTYVYDNGYYFETFESVDDAVQSALDENEEVLSDAKLNDSMIGMLYSDLSDAPYDTEELLAIQDAVIDVQDSYENFYELITNPTGNYSEFYSSFDELDTAVAEKYQAFYGLLD